VKNLANIEWRIIEYRIEVNHKDVFPFFLSFFIISLCNSPQEQVFETALSWPEGDLLENQALITFQVWYRGIPMRLGENRTIHMSFYDV
jgi:hypothetical protein